MSGGWLATTCLLEPGDSIRDHAGGIHLSVPVQKRFVFTDLLLKLLVVADRLREHVGPNGGG